MNIGLFALFENKIGHLDAFDSQFELMLHAEQLGFDEMWMAEHHFNNRSISSALLPIMAYAAAKTSKIRLGSAAVLLPFYNPIRLAEDIATIDLLSQGRLNLGIAKGGPFDEQFRNFGIMPDESRTVSLEVAEILEKLLYEEHVSYRGERFNLENVTLTPKPLQLPIPIYHATHSDEGIAYAARHNHKLLAAQPWNVEMIRRHLAHYEQCGGNPSKKVAVFKTFLVAKNRKEARSEVLPSIERFLSRMRDNPHIAHTDFLDPERHLNNAILGSVNECIEAIEQLRESVDPCSLVIKPAAMDNHRTMELMEIFTRDIRPQLTNVKEIK
jgi:alkanesulfonate monooxygenase SsuD/methylene tetrahydromethanopterin reductase-like flavin-dependent oxidoreductase (luciferase family)